MVKRIKNMGLATKIIIAMIFGGVLGIVIGKPMMQLGFIGDIWLNSIKMAIVPMILAAIISGIVSQKDIASLGRVAAKILVYYSCTTILAGTVGITVTSIIQPGKWSSLSGMKGAKVSGTLDMTVQSFFTDMFSDNMFASFSNGNILQTLVIAIIMGIAILMMKDGKSKDKIIGAVNVFNDFVFSLIGLIMELSPIGVFFLMGDAFGEYGLKVIKSIAALAGTFYIGCLVQIIVVYGGVLFLFSRINPIKFLKDSAMLWMCTLATASSVASIPVNLQVAREKFNVPDNISSFTIPLGSQMNADGNAILDACIVLFIAQNAGIHLSFGSVIQIVLMATILSMGGNGIPGSGIVKTLVLVEAFGLPVQIVGIVAAFYRLFDMGATTNNCLGDLVGTVFVARTEERRALKKKKKQEALV